METLLNRYRNITVLLLVIFAQIILLAYQVRNDSDVRLIRVWAVTAVTPVARTIESVRSGAARFLQDYVVLRDVRDENRRMLAELGRLKMENQFLKTELATADRARALSAFEARTPSRMIAARVIGTATGASSNAVFLDRGSAAGVQKGMAVVTPDGIVGKVLASYPTASLALLVTDPTFAAGVISQKNHVRGTLKGLGHGNCRVDYVQNEEKVEAGEWFYTSGDDRIFPKGLPVGTVTAARSGSTFQDISLEPTGLASGLEEALIVLEGVHQAIPDLKAASSSVYLAPPPPPGPGDAEAGPPAGTNSGGAGPSAPATDADRIRERYQEIGEAQGHKFGEGLPGSKPPDFNLKMEQAPKPDTATRRRGDAATGPQPLTPNPRPPAASNPPR